MSNFIASMDSIQIPLTQGKFALVSPEDADLASFNWRAQKNSQKVEDIFYAVFASKNNITTMMHRIVMQRILGRPLLRGDLVDHWDRDGLNNTRANLRLASASQNQQNRKVGCNNRSGYKGVNFYKRRNLWRAQITVNGKMKSIGYYDTPEMAAYSYNQAALKYFGEFAKLNDLPDEFTPTHCAPRKMGRPKGSLGKVGTYSRKKTTNTSSGYKGVTWHKSRNKWMAYIRVDGNQVYLGLFTNIIDAARAFNTASLERYGDLALLNDIPE